MNPDLQVALSPARTYRALAARPPEGRPGFAVAGRVALFSVIFGATLAISATERVAAGLVASTTLCWSFAAAVQVIAAALLVGVAPARRVSAARAIDLFFMGGAPWSLWLLAFAGRAALSRSGGGLTDPFIVTAAVPLAWTGAVVFAFCREVLGAGARAAALRTAAHQAVVWTVAGVYLANAVQAWPRFLHLVAR